MEKQLKRDKKIHFLAMAFMVALVLAAIGISGWSVYSHSNNVQGEKPIEGMDAATGAGEKKNLPDFMLENINSNELEQLKP